MKLTEAKLKQMILDEIKSNLSLADQDQLYADIELVQQLSAEIVALRQQISTYGWVYGRKRPPEIVEIDQSIVDKSSQIDAISKKYDILLPYDSPDNHHLIHLMKKKFRRKNL